MSNKPLSEKYKDVSLFTPTSRGELNNIYFESDVKQAVKEAYEEIENKSSFKNDSGLIFLGDVKEIFKQNFGFDLSEAKE